MSLQKGVSVFSSGTIPEASSVGHVIVFLFGDASCNGKHLVVTRGKGGATVLIKCSEYQASVGP